MLDGLTFATVHQAGSDFKQHFHFQKEKPEIQVRILNYDMLCWSIMGDYIFRNHLAPRTELSVAKDDFPKLLNKNKS